MSGFFYGNQSVKVVPVPETLRTWNAGYEYEYFFNTTSVVIWPKAGNSGNILLKPIRVLVTYEE